jgi:ubiquinone/menaquinone biosynthesis C-methylase UbiE
LKGEDRPKLDVLYGLKWGDPKKPRSLAARISNACRVLVKKEPIYGMEWGDPDRDERLQFVRDHFLMPYLTPETIAVEIGPGGGRWTRYMLGVRKVYAVDYHRRLLKALKLNFPSDVIVPVKNNGDDFPGIPDASADFVFSFDTFVHLDMPIIDAYLRNIRRLLKPTSNVFIHYSDKRKPAAMRNKSFSDNDPQRMRELVSSHGYQIYEEDTETMHHSAMIRFGVGEQN